MGIKVIFYTKKYEVFIYLFIFAFRNKVKVFYFS